jgi:hypothetical protein
MATEVVAADDGSKSYRLLVGSTQAGTTQSLAFWAVIDVSGEGI